MNFELLLKLSANNKDNIKNKQHIKNVIKYFYSHLKINKQRLKLGTIVFEYTNYSNPELSFDSDFEVRFQSSQEFIDEFVVFQNSVKEHDWRWDFANISAFLFLFSIFLLEIFCIVHNWSSEHLDFYFKNKKKTKFANDNFYKFYLKENKLFLTSTFNYSNNDFIDFLALNLSRIKVL